MEMPDLLPNRLNFDAIVFCGCTMKEMQIIAILSLTFCTLALGFLMKWLINMFLVGMGLAFPAAVGLSLTIAVIFQRAKQGKPKGFLNNPYYCGLKIKGYKPHRLFDAVVNGQWGDLFNAISKCPRKCACLN